MQPNEKSRLAAPRSGALGGKFQSRDGGSAQVMAVAEIGSSLKRMASQSLIRNPAKAITMTDANRLSWQCRHSIE
jgi:hypothetical protein